MKTTKEIHQLYEMNNDGERDISQDIWYSENELKDILDYWVSNTKEQQRIINTFKFRLGLEE